MSTEIITLMVWGEDFEQELRPLIKAFYPGAQFEVTKETWDGCLVKDAASFLKILKEQDAPWDYAFLLYPQEGYFAARGKEGWQAGEFHHIPANAQRRDYRNVMMRGFYRMLQEQSERVLPWGILTGIRPTKLMLEHIEAGESESEVRAYMEEEYLCSKEKIDVGIEVAKREHKILSLIDCAAGYSVYIGIPFCPSTCYYCSFTSFPVGVYGGLMDDYLAALEKEIRYAGDALPGKQLHTLYIGGGTPTTLSEKQLDRLLTCIEENFDLSHLKEFTVEAGRPDSITKEKLAVIHSHKVGRISINPQTMKQETLNLIGRRHTVEQIEETFYLARELGFDNINMDLILGLAKETPQDVAKTLEKIGKLSPDNLTVHTLAVKRAARLTTNKEEYEGFEAKDVQKMQRFSSEFAAANNYYPYYLYRQKNITENLENIGYARPGKEGLYNILIMEEKQTILALGAGATTKFVFHSKNQLERVENVKNLKDYIGRIDEMIARKQNFLARFGREL